ncbi:MAG: DUF308 domain-containing protein [Bacteroidales bacterium]|jgi:uncharacterized membrane protein HdeD (DUF308 family)|nr:DUF308 domain-containing protein [Bacteroidales bacterium]
MKKITVTYSTLRILSALVLGVFLLLNPDAVNYVVITIGILFIIPGLLAFINYVLLSKGKRPDTVYMLGGLGSLLLGLALVIQPTFFVTVLMYILGAVLVLGGIEQFVNLFRVRAFIAVAKGFYIVPLLLFLVGIVVLFNPFETARTIFTLIGAMFLVYGITEIVYYIKFAHKKERSAHNQEVITQS